MAVNKQRLAILFVCTGNACRSQIAEGWAKYLLRHSVLWDAYDIHIASAGLEAHGLNSSAVAVMREVGIDISRQTSDLMPDQLDDLDWVITLCDHADQYCPEFKVPVQRLHWGLSDPAKAKPGQGDGLKPFRTTREEVKIRMQKFVSELEQAMLLEDLALKELLPEFDGQDVEVTRTPVYKDFLQIDQLQVKHKRFEGGWSDIFQRELMVKQPAVMVILYDPMRDELVLIEQFRVGALGDQRSPWLLEMVAGIVESGESLEEVACRESLEEAGCEVLELERITSVWMTPGGCDEQITLFCGRVDSSQADGVHGLDDEHEDIRVKVVSVATAEKALRAGLICNAASVIALQWLQLNKDALQKRWCDNKG